MSKEKLQGIFRCSKCQFDTDATNSPAEQEDEWYGHLRNNDHEYSYSKPCQNCGKKTTGKVKSKVPQPTADVKAPKSIIVFCDNDSKCRNEYLKNLGVK